MKKSFIYNMAAMLLGGAVAVCGLTACTSEDNVVENAQKPVQQAPVCYLSLPATIGDAGQTRAVTLGENTATTSFETTDKVYVYIEGQGANDGILAYGYDMTNNEMASMTLSNINGTTCDLSGALTFYYNMGAYTPAENDIVHLVYNMYNASYDSYSFKYANQNGNKDAGYTDPSGYDVPEYYCWGAGHYDFAEAKMVVTTATGDDTNGYTLELKQYDDPSKTTVSFKNLQSMFRQRLTFTDKNSQAIAAPTITKFTVTTANDKIVSTYYPFGPAPMATNYVYSPLEIEDPTLTTDGDIYFVLAFNDENKNEALILTAEDTDGNIYTVTKAAPASGFANGNYYYGTAAMAWLKCPRPTVTGTSASPTYGIFNVEEDPVALTISGTSEDYRFSLSHGGTVTLDNVTASNYYTFISQDISANDDLQMILTGTNQITTAADYGISVAGEGRNLLLSCTGASATLTVTSKNLMCCGIHDTDYDFTGMTPPNNYDYTDEIDVSAKLAAPGYSVIRSARIAGPDNNSDGYPDNYTWTYTVFPKTAYYAATSDDVGKVIGSDGKIYATQAAAEAVSGVTAVAMIAFVGKIDGECEHGMAISLTDAYGYNATYAQATGDIIIPDWQTAHPVSGGTWRLPSEADWQRMIWGYYTATPEGAAAATATKAALTEGYYWTSTEVDADNAKLIYYDGSTYASVQSSAKTNPWHVRACLAF